MVSNTESFIAISLCSVANYRRFNFSATVGNLQAKVESLTTTNALMKEDLAIAKKNIASLTEDNKSLKTGEKKKDSNSDRSDEARRRINIEVLTTN